MHGSGAKSCCVLKPMGDDTLRALQDPKLSDPQILKQLDTASNTRKCEITFR